MNKRIDLTTQRRMVENFFYHGGWYDLMPDTRGGWPKTEFLSLGVKEYSYIILREFFGVTDSYISEVFNKTSKYVNTCFKILEHDKKGIIYKEILAIKDKDNLIALDGCNYGLFRDINGSKEVSFRDDLKPKKLNFVRYYPSNYAFDTINVRIKWNGTTQYEYVRNVEGIGVVKTVLKLSENAIKYLSDYPFFDIGYQIVKPNGYVSDYEYPKYEEIINYITPKDNGEYKGYFERSVYEYNPLNKKWNFSNVVENSSDVYRTKLYDYELETLLHNRFFERVDNRKSMIYYKDENNKYNFVYVFNGNNKAIIAINESKGLEYLYGNILDYNADGQIYFEVDDIKYWELPDDVLTYDWIKYPTDKDHYLLNSSYLLDKTSKDIENGNILGFYKIDYNGNKILYNKYEITSYLKTLFSEYKKNDADYILNVNREKNKVYKEIYYVTEKNHYSGNGEKVKIKLPDYVTYAYQLIWEGTLIYAYIEHYKIGELDTKPTKRIKITDRRVEFDGEKVKKLDTWGESIEFSSAFDINNGDDAIYNCCLLLYKQRLITKQQYIDVVSPVINKSGSDKIFHENMYLMFMDIEAGDYEIRNMRIEQADQQNR